VPTLPRPQPYAPSKLIAAPDRVCAPHALRASIRTHGVLVAVVRDQHGRIIDGHHRERIAAELGVACPVETVRLIAATPVGHVDGLERLREEADLVVCPHPLEEIAVVGQAYDIFDPLEEWYVAGLLADAATP
jgi:hypothetical protein